MILSKGGEGAKYDNMIISKGDGVCPNMTVDGNMGVGVSRHPKSDDVIYGLLSNCYRLAIDLQLQLLV
jgi:hypothetical protein